MTHHNRTIGMIHYQVGHNDGVSLEMDKWKQVLEEQGHTVHLCAGELGITEGTLIEEMYHHRADAKRLYYNTFSELRDYPGEAEYRAELLDLASGIETRFREFIEEKSIDFLIPQNVWSVAVNPAVSIAVTRVMRDMQLPALAHNHDFYWERSSGVALTCGTALELAEKYLPPHDASARHVVINSLARRELLERKGIKSTVVPNVFDFDAPPWQPDEFSCDLRARIGLKKNDVLILQATRVVRRKGIELAVDLVRALDSPDRRARLRERGLYNGQAFGRDSRIVLVMAGYTRDDVNGGYVRRLRQKIERAGIDALFIGDHLIGAGRQEVDQQKVYSLWDSYPCADLVTFPSLGEGWGNQFLEALRARLPLVLFEYPVYLADIKDKGFRVISLGSEIQGRDDLGLAQVAQWKIESAADQAVEVLTNASRRQSMVEHNFRIARQHYSLHALRGYLARLMRDGARS